MTSLPQPPRLRPLPEDDVERVLCVVAHPDDMEYGAAAAVARWTASGRTVTYLLATRGEAGINDRDPGEVGPLREQEEITGAREVGVQVVEFLDHRDGVVEYGLPLRRDIARAVRRHRPQLVVGMNHHERFPGGMPNQADHRAVGLATLDGVRDAGNRWIFPELLAEGLAPWGGTRMVALAGSPVPTHYTDVTGYLPQAVRSLEAHREYLRGLGEDTIDPEEFLTWMAAAVGEPLDLEAAVAFEVFEV
jgi:LmbE family N-acetylglucosaminyl deacetylase